MRRSVLDPDFADALEEVLRGHVARSNFPRILGAWAESPSAPPIELLRHQASRLDPQRRGDARRSKTAPESRTSCRSKGQGRH